ncbi:MAG: hypothetical protein B5M56_10015 [Desulfococcus sp. 4484_241]|nr:MAG: hypothetical protein B5M56_10015 [Desulfococcus sp. 4484_241]
MMKEDAESSHAGIRGLTIALAQASGLLILSAAVALLFNHVRPNGLPVITTVTNAPQQNMAASGGMSVTLQEAISLYKKGGAVFVDARGPEAYRAGHIPGAFNLPFGREDDFLEHFFKAVPDTKALIVTYCDGNGCTLGEELAGMLKGLGYENVRVFEGGWAQWQKHKYPVKSGEKDGS